jgi:hypothetical protein
MANAKDPPSAVQQDTKVGIDAFQKQFAAAQEARIPYKEKLLESLLRTQLKILGDPDSSAQMARYIHNLYESLIKEGFSKDEALQIASRVPFPPATSPLY